MVPKVPRGGLGAFSSTGTSCCGGATGGVGSISGGASVIRDALVVLRLLLEELLLPEEVLLRGAVLPVLDFEDEVGEEDEELFVDVFAVVDDFGDCEGSSSP